MHARLLLLLAAVSVAACDRTPLRAPTAPVEYRPELAGTVDHALCLLGFSATPMRVVLTGHQLVDGELNGRPATFVIDTGANVSVVHTGYADAFGLRAQRGVGGAAIGLGGGMRAGRAGIESLRVGSLDIRQRHIMIADLGALEQVLGRLSRTPIHGIVGQDVLREHRAVIDVSRPMLYLQADDAAPAPVAAERCGG